LRQIGKCLKFKILYAGFCFSKNVVICLKIVLFPFQLKKISSEKKKIRSLFFKRKTEKKKALSIKEGGRGCQGFCDIFLIQLNN